MLGLKDRAKNNASLMIFFVEIDKANVVRKKVIFVYMQQPNTLYSHIAAQALCFTRRLKQVYATGLKA